MKKRWFSFNLKIDIGRLRLIWANDGLINGIQFYSKRIGKISLLGWRFLYCFYTKESGR